MEEKKVILSVKDYSISFCQYERGWKQRTITPIERLNLEMKEGELVAIVGASGSGKSLLAHGILGILPYNATTSGELYFDGELLTEKRIESIRGKELVLVPQGVSYLDPLMKIGDQLEQGKKDKDRKLETNKALYRYGLEEDTKKLYPFELSGGMARRVLISTAVMEKPKLMIADEPTPGLHLEAAKRVLSHFRELANEGVGVLLITHDLELALEVADRVIVFYEGTTIESVLPEDFVSEERLQHPYTKALYRAMPQHQFRSEETLCH